MELQRCVSVCKQKMANCSSHWLGFQVEKKTRVYPETYQLLVHSDFPPRIWPDMAIVCNSSVETATFFRL